MLNNPIIHDIKLKVLCNLLLSPVQRDQPEIVYLLHLQWMLKFISKIVAGMPSSLTKINQLTKNTKIKKGHLQAPATTPHNELTMETMMIVSLETMCLCLLIWLRPQKEHTTPEYNGSNNIAHVQDIQETVIVSLSCFYQTPACAAHE